MKLGLSDLLIGLILASPARTLADDSPLSLPDLEAYRAALEAKPGDSAPLVRFRELWDHPEAHAGRIVSVEGRLARTFRQPKIGEFPPLVEAWVVSPSGDPFCLVFPGREHTDPPSIGASIRFSGTFLKNVKYQGGDVARLAPLIVGPDAPSASRIQAETEGMNWSTSDWMMAGGGLMVVGLILMRRHLFRPIEVPRALDPPPSFVDGDPDEEGNPHEIR